MSAISKIKAAMKLAQELKTAPVEVNQSRRTMGLSLPKPESVTDIANYHANNAPAVVPQPNLVPPLQTIMNMPVSRRKVLQTPVQAAVSHVGRGLIGDMAIKPIIPVESLTADAAPPYVPSLNPSALKFVLPLVPLATVKVLLA